MGDILVRIPFERGTNTITDTFLQIFIILKYNQLHITVGATRSTYVIGWFQPNPLPLLP